MKEKVAEQRIAQDRLNSATDRMEESKKALAHLRRGVAEMANDLGRLGVPEEVIKKCLNKVNAHDLSVWLTAE